VPGSFKPPRLPTRLPTNSTAFGTADAFLLLLDSGLAPLREMQWKESGLSPVGVWACRCALHGRSAEWLGALAKAGVPCAVSSSIDRLTLLAALDRMKLFHFFRVSAWQKKDLQLPGTECSDEALPLLPGQCLVSGEPGR